MKNSGFHSNFHNTTRTLLLMWLHHLMLAMFANWCCYLAVTIVADDCFSMLMPLVGCNGHCHHWPPVLQCCWCWACIAALLGLLPVVIAVIIDMTIALVNCFACLITAHVASWPCLSFITLAAMAPQLGCCWVGLTMLSNAYYLVICAIMVAIAIALVDSLKICSFPSLLLPLAATILTTLLPFNLHHDEFYACYLCHCHHCCCHHCLGWFCKIMIVYHACCGYGCHLPPLIAPCTASMLPSSLNLSPCDACYLMLPLPSTAIWHIPTCVDENSPSYPSMDDFILWHDHHGMIGHHNIMTLSLGNGHNFI